MGYCCLIRSDRHGELSSGAEAVNACLSGLLLILSFDQRCLRYQEKWHVFPLGVLVQISFAKVAWSRCSTAFAVALDTKKALDPRGERLLLYPGTTSNAAAIAASRTLSHREVVHRYC